MSDELDTTTPPSGGNSAGLVDIARGATPPGGGQAEPLKRGRGRPPGSGAKPAPEAAGPSAAGVGPLTPFIWNETNAGALTRPPFALAAFATGIKDLALTKEEESILIPAMIPIYQEFFPMMSPRLAAAIGALATLGPIFASKVSIYLKTVDEEKKKMAKKEELAK